VPADPQLALQHLQRQHHGSFPPNTDVGVNAPTWHPVRPLSSSSFSSSDSPSELINTPANFPSELGGYPNQISIATDDHMSQPSGVHDSWLLANTSFAAFTDGFAKEVTTPGFIDLPPHRFSNVYEPPAAMPPSYYTPPVETTAQFFEPETPAQLYMRTFKAHVSPPHDSYSGYPDGYVNQMHTRSHSLPNMPFQGSPSPAMATAWNDVRNDFVPSAWSCPTHQRSWA